MIDLVSVWCAKPARVGSGFVSELITRCAAVDRLAFDGSTRSVIARFKGSATIVIPLENVVSMQPERDPFDDSDEDEPVTAASQPIKPPQGAKAK